MGFFGNKNSKKLEEYEKRKDAEKYQEGANKSYEKWENNKSFNDYKFRRSDCAVVDEARINSENDVGNGERPRRITDVSQVDTRKIGFPSQSAHSVKWDTNEKIDSDLTKDKNQDARDRGQ